jgi:hypothetical protein
MSHQWAIPQLRELLPLDDSELEQILTYASTLDDAEAAQHLENLFGDSPKSLGFISSFLQHRRDSQSQEAFERKKEQDLIAEKKFNMNGFPPPSVTADNNDSSLPPPAYTTVSDQTVASNLYRPVAPYKHVNSLTEVSKWRAKDEVRIS